MRTLTLGAELGRPAALALQLCGVMDDSKRHETPHSCSPPSAGMSILFVGTIDVTIWSFLMPYMGYLLPSLTYLHKAPYGVSGLSADLLAMERSELHVLRRVHEERLVSTPFWVLATLFSRVKYLKRLVHVLARRRLSS